MFYKQFLEITEVLNADFVENFDYWLATLPRNRQKNITASMVAAKFEVQYSLAELILKYAEQHKILEHYFLVKCPECDDTLLIISENAVAEILSTSIYCSECDRDEKITTDHIYIAYKVIQQPDVTEEQIYHAIEQKLIKDGHITGNFIDADSLSSNVETLYKVFYNPSESAYYHLKALRKKLDSDYNKNTTAKGRSLENLVCALFNEITGISCTTDIKTETNQFDCTAFCSIKTPRLSIFDYLSPYFIIECKNEPNNKPNNTYCNKLLSIMETNEAQVGIIWSRLDAASTCFKISKEHYLLHKNSGRHQIIVTFCDTDLDNLIDKEINLLQYLETKIAGITLGDKNIISKTY